MNLRTLIPLTALLSLAGGVATADASLRLRMGDGPTKIIETKPARDVLRIRWDPATKISRFTNPSGIRLSIPGGDRLPGQYGGNDGCEQLTRTEVACGFLKNMFSGSSSNWVDLGRRNDVLMADRDLPEADYAAVGATGLTVNMGPGRDVFYGTDFYDYVSGGPGDDRLFGRGDADELHGCAGNDLLHGGNAEGPFSDSFPKRYRTNSLWGGPGRDRFKGKTIKGYIIQGGPCA